jgi:hypothetical protein
MLSRKGGALIAGITMPDLTIATQAALDELMA